MGCTLIKSADEKNWGVHSLGLEAVLDLHRLEDWANRNVLKMKSKYNFLLLGWTYGMGQAGDWEHGEQLHRKGCGGGGQQAEHEPEVHPSR